VGWTKSTDSASQSRRIGIAGGPFSTQLRCSLPLRGTSSWSWQIADLQLRLKHEPHGKHTRRTDHVSDD